MFPQVWFLYHEILYLENLFISGSRGFDVNESGYSFIDFAQNRLQ